MKHNKQNGFTLIELLTVIAIIGLLATVIFAILLSARSRAKDARRKEELKHLRIVLELYYQIHGRYPACHSETDDGSNLSANSTSWDCMSNALIADNLTKYILRDPDYPTLGYHYDNYCFIPNVDSSYSQAQYYRMWSYGMSGQPGAIIIWWNSAVIGETNCTLPSTEYYDDSSHTIIQRTRP